jgi:hypothetical protein
MVKHDSKVDKNAFKNKCKVILIPACSYTYVHDLLGNVSKSI